MSEPNLGRDLDQEDVNIAHRFIHLWNAAAGIDTNVVVDLLEAHKRT